jgi:hypothetical protein
MVSCGRLATGPFRVTKDLRRLTTAAQLAKLPHKYRAHTGQELRRNTLDADVGDEIRARMDSAALARKMNASILSVPFGFFGFAIP